MAETPFLLTCLFAIVFVFFFGYGMVEDLIRQPMTQPENSRKINHPTVDQHASSIPEHWRI